MQKTCVFTEFFDFCESELPKTCDFIEFFDILEFKAKIKCQRQLQQHGASFVTSVRPQTLKYQKTQWNHRFWATLTQKSQKTQWKHRFSAPSCQNPCVFQWISDSLCQGPAAGPPGCRSCRLHLILALNSKISKKNSMKTQHFWHYLSNKSKN